MLLQSLIERQDERRDELGKELHNNVNQLLASARLLLEMAREENGGGDTDLLGKGLQCLDEAIIGIRRITRSLNSGIVDDIGLEAAIGQLMNSGWGGQQIRACISYDPLLDEALPPAVQLMVYRIIREQMENIYRYADAQCISIVLEKRYRSFRLTVADDGKGFDVRRAARSKGMGFIVINNRVAAYDGIFELFAAPGEGCRLEIEVPLPVAEEA